MTAINDLTFQQMQTELPTGVISVAAGVLSINLTTLLGSGADAMIDVGVVKALSILLDAAYKAQVLANVGQPIGERLAAFLPPATGAISAGFAPTTRSLVTRAEISTAVNIIGQVA